ncbi:sensor histidine kinase [Spirosoma validum]|uniref:Histidine kinase n=1 Tax=Spirosoma validum TaxID=2771355 RepID=A0A927GDD9_9BACT|nr:histidine kinase [Spirosoma validum]MBD2753697.1 histidine kinase [Spirosoma validum]
MTFQIWGAVFTGMVLSIMLLNVVQWMTYRDRSYGLYTLYMLAWLFYFGLRVYAFRDWFSAETNSFVRAVAPMGAYYVYFDFADAILDLRRRLPQFYRNLQLIKVGIVGYVTIHVVLCYVPSMWHPNVYETTFIAMRLAMAVVGVYGIRQMASLGDVVSKAYALGTAFLLTGGLTTMFLSMTYWCSEDWSGPFWGVSLTYMQIGIIAELVCFTLGLGYRQRQAAVRSAVVEQELTREREKHHRDQLEAELAVQRLEQEKTEVHIRALQAQVNPHFLFNSLNSLSALIDEDTQKAGLFLDELSSVYRYLLRANDQVLTPLAAELTFIRSYCHLLQTRHGSALRIVWQVEPPLLNRQLPPLTLQLLIENAVKHNIALPQRPLTIAIMTNEKGQLQVRNNVQRKSIRVASNGVGLSNIWSKYQMLNQPLPTLLENNGQFVVSLPLISVD